MRMVDFAHSLPGSAVQTSSSAVKSDTISLVNHFESLAADL